MTHNGSPSSFHCYEIHGKVCLQPTVINGPGKESTSNQTTVTLGRDSSRRIVVRLLMQCSRRLQSVSYLLQDVTVHHKFAKQEGKGGIVIPSKQLQITFSNCPPDKLNVFLKTLEAKLEILKKSGLKRLNEMHFTDMPLIVEELSPLTMNEIKQMRRFKDVTNTNGLNRTINNPKKSPGLTPKTSKYIKIHQNNNPLTSPSLQKPNNKIGMKRRLNEGTPSLSKSESISSNISLSEEQKNVLRLVSAGNNIFFTGSAGTGKSLVLKKLIGILPAETTVVTAATGVAACHIGGTTIHSFAGIGAGTATIDKCFELASRKGIAQMWRKCSHLIIDEVSMIDAQYFSKIEQVARYVRGSTLAFGGIQIILCGDFLQLPPVAKYGEKRKFCFESSAWDRCVDKSIVLKEVRRQTDEKFIQILQNVRIGICNPEDAEILLESKNHCINREGVLATRLCTHKDDAQAINDAEMEKLKNVEMMTFHSDDSMQVPTDLKNSGCLKTLTLKVGSQVLLTKNLSLARNLSNGSRGVVQKFVKGYPLVRFLSGHTEILGRSRFIVRLPVSNVKVARLQIPLQLAWAISIHKSQGMSLDSVEMSLARVFEDGQAYVALSRATSLSGLKILDFNPACIRANQTVLQFYKNLMYEAHLGEHEHEQSKRIKLS